MDFTRPALTVRNGAASSGLPERRRLTDADPNRFGYGTCREPVRTGTPAFLSEPEVGFEPTT
jgi:hypothetical protein